MRGSTRKRGKTWTAYWDTADENGTASSGAREDSSRRSGSAPPSDCHRPVGEGTPSSPQRSRSGGT